MIIDNWHLLDSIFDFSNIPSSDEDIDLFNKFSNNNNIDLSDSAICGYLSRNVKKMEINLSKLDEVGYSQLIELVKKCDGLTWINFKTLSPRKIDNTLLNNLVCKNNMQKILFQKSVMVDCDYLFTILDKVSVGTAIRVRTLDTEEQELRYLKLPRTSQSKLIVSSFSKQLYEDIAMAQRYCFVDVSLYFNYKEFFNNLSDFNIVINNVSELGLDKLNELKSDSRVNGIVVRCGFDAAKTYVYSIQDYENILLAIYDIISKIKMPSDDDINREKIIFAQLYRILGEIIVYDYYAITEEGKKDESLSIECRNLKNGLLGVYRDGKKVYTCVCAGYATILQNVCAVLGIKCDYISSFSRAIDYGVEIIDPRNRTYENGTNDPMGHAYVGVELDGQGYLCDLTYDSPMIRANGVVCDFLKSYDDFYISHYDCGFEESNVHVVSMSGETKQGLDKNIYNRTASDSEIEMLFGFSIEQRIEEMRSIGYLGGFVEEYINFVKECKSTVEILDLKDILNTVCAIENYVLSDEFKNRNSVMGLSAAIPVVVRVGDKETKRNIAFYNPENSTVEEYVASVESRVNHGRK